MGLKRFRPYTASRRAYTVSDFDEITSSKPAKTLTSGLSKSGGRNCYGHATNCNTGGGHKRKYRQIDFRRHNKAGVPGQVISIEYDPNRTARIALVSYKDGEHRYILAPNGLTVGMQIMSGPGAEIKVGNSLPLRVIPTGESIHSLALAPNGKAIVARSAGMALELVAKEHQYGLVRLPSGEMRKVHLDCYATIGVVGNADHLNRIVGKAGRSRWLGRRPHNRGISKNPVDHAMGGRTNGGKHPSSPYGVPAKGYKTRQNKRTDKFIVRRRNASKAVAV
jgi:large subunit ribosomal protein L2